MTEAMGPTLIDLFAGAGGMAEGFRRAGFQPVLAVEIDRDAAATYSANLGGDVLVQPVECVADTSFPNVDVLIGGPPCQGFSPLGRMNGNGHRGALNDLWRQFARVLGAVLPEAFVLENVPQLLRSVEFKGLRRHAEDLGYEVDARVLNAVDFGVPQKRKRAIVVGSRRGSPRFPMPQASPAKSVRDAIGHLGKPFGHGDDVKSGEESRGLDIHFNRRPRSISLRRYRLIPPGGNRFDLMEQAPNLTPRCWKEKPTGSTDVFGRLEWDKPSLTIRTEFFKPEKGRYLHPEQHRPITHLEAALFQTFPDDYVWSGSKVSVARQIGNAVPVLFAQAIAHTVAEMLSDAAGGTYLRSRLL